MKTKNKKAISTLIAVTIAFSILVAFSATASATVINVPTNQPTIQAAVNAAASGDTIIVAAGTYNEAVVINRGLTSLTLQGANAGTPGTGTRVAETIIQAPDAAHTKAIDIWDDGIVVDGFTLMAGLEDSADIVDVRGDHVVIKNNIITPYSSAGVFHPPGVFACDCTDLTVEYNLIQNTGGCGIFLGLNWGGTYYYVSNSLIEGNLIDNSGYTGILFIAGSNLMIRNNIIRDVGVLDVHNDDGIRVAQQGDFVTIEQNDIYGCLNDGIRIRSNAANHVIHYNNIYGNTNYGVQNQDTTATLDATYNWWGDTSGPSGAGPGTGDAVSANVDYCPWLSIVEYGDVSLSGGFQAGHFDDIWDLTQGDIEIQFTYDANGLVDDAGCHAWAELGIREVGYGDFNPTWQVEGAGVWLATDYDWNVNTFDPDTLIYYGPPYNDWFGTLDLDDKLILQKGGGCGEGGYWDGTNWVGGYNLPSIPPAPGSNHRVWWDRDGVDPWQNDETANTGGIYYVEIRLHATSDTTGEAYMTINGLNQGFETDGNWNTIELTPAGMTFTGDMTRMQVFYGIYGYGATHSVSFKDITIKRYYTTVIDTLTVTPDLVPITDAVVALTATFTSPCGSPHTATIDWGDGTIEYGTVSESSGSGTVTGDHTYTDTGVHTVTLSVKDSASQTYIKEYQYVVVYDPSAGFVTGGGWINSPEGAYKTNPTLTGKANFGFVSKYKKGQPTPTGNTEFQFKAGDLNFHSDNYDWLVIAAAHKAMYKGTGTINGDGNFGFMLSVIDEKLTPSTDVDMFRIKIWDKDAGDAVVYDNNIGNDDADDADPATEIAGGQIVIHKAK